MIPELSSSLKLWSEDDRWAFLSPAAPGQDQVSDGLHAEHGAEEEAAGGESGRPDGGAHQAADAGSVTRSYTMFSTMFTMFLHHVLHVPPPCSPCSSTMFLHHVPCSSTGLLTFTSPLLCLREETRGVGEGEGGHQQTGWRRGHQGRKQSDRHRLSS